MKCGACANFAVYFNIAAVALDNSVDHCKADSGALARALGGKIWIKYFFHNDIIHPMTRIADR